MPIPKERLFALIDASREILATQRHQGEAITSALIQRAAGMISEPQLTQLIYEALEFHQPNSTTTALIQHEYAWRLATGSRNEYRKIWMQQQRAERTPHTISTHGLSRAQVLAEFRRENGIPDPDTITLESIGLDVSGDEA